MKLIYDGFAFSTKYCSKCHKKFIFEKYVKYYRIISPRCAGYEYICKSCYKRKAKENELN